MGSHDLDVSGFHNHGDRCCPQFLGLWDPFHIGFPWLINGGDPITTNTIPGSPSSKPGVDQKKQNIRHLNQIPIQDAHVDSPKV